MDGIFAVAAALEATASSSQDSRSRGSDLKDEGGSWGESKDRGGVDSTGVATTKSVC
jgi:hypothetical protein